MTSSHLGIRREAAAHLGIFRNTKSCSNELRGVLVERVDAGEGGAKDPCQGWRHGILELAYEHHRQDSQLFLICNVQSQRNGVVLTVLCQALKTRAGDSQYHVAMAHFAATKCAVAVIKALLELTFRNGTLLALRSSDCLGGVENGRKITFLF